MDPSCLVTTVQAAGGGGVNGVGDVFLAHFRPLSANWTSEHQLQNAIPPYQYGAFSALLNQCHIKLRHF